jgi:hypothetical protein
MAAGDTSSRTALPMMKLLDQSRAVKASAAWVGSGQLKRCFGCWRIMGCFLSV